MEQNNTKSRNAKIYIRILPCMKIHPYIKVDKTCMKEIYVRCLQEFTSTNLKNTKKPQYWRFITDGIFFNQSQDYVYSEVMGDVMKRILQGCNVLILCYGQTGAGKTFTTTGLGNNYAGRGIVLRLLQDMFMEKQKRANEFIITYCMSYIEINGDNVRDLLGPYKVTIPHNLGYAFKDVKIHPINQEADGLRLICEGEGRRTVLEEAPYDYSHPGHSILTIYTTIKSILNTTPVTLNAKIHIVDMAGIDTYGKTDIHWKGNREVGAANVVKSMLEQFLVQLSHPHHKQRPNTERINKFLSYLSDSLSPRSVMRFVGHIRGNSSYLIPTLSVLRFGERVLQIPSSLLEMSQEPQPDVIITDLKNKVNELTDQLKLTQMLADQPVMTNISQQQVKQIHNLAQNYLMGEVDEITLLSIGQATITLQRFKDLFTTLSAEKEILEKKLTELSEETSQLQKDKITMPPPKKQTSKQKETEKIDDTVPTVGVSSKQGISIGPPIISSFEGPVTEAEKQKKKEINVPTPGQILMESEEEVHPYKENRKPMENNHYISSSTKMANALAQLQVAKNLLPRIESDELDGEEVQSSLNGDTNGKWRRSHSKLKRIIDMEKFNRVKKVVDDEYQNYLSTNYMCPWTKIKIPSQKVEIPSSDPHLDQRIMEYQYFQEMFLYRRRKKKESRWRL